MTEFAEMVSLCLLTSVLSDDVATTHIRVFIFFPAALCFYDHGEYRRIFVLFPFNLCLPCFDACCWLGGKKGIRPVKTEWWGAGVVICLELGADLHMAQLMPLPLHHCLLLQ